VRPISHLG
jgi:hypothetical protein